MPDGVIPSSPYPVLQEARKPSRYVDGPYIASRPAYQMFAEQARTGASIGDLIAADKRAQAKSDGRPDPVKEMPENRQFWFHDGEMEPIPDWPNASNPAKLPPAAPPPAVPPVAAPSIPGPSAAAPSVAAPSVAAPSAAPAPAPSIAPPAPVPPADAAPPPTAGVASRRPSAATARTSAATAPLDLPPAPVAGRAPSAAARPSPVLPSADAATRAPARRQAASPRPSAVQQQLASASYPRPTHQDRVAQRAAARHGDTLAL
jgi:hypothetical protein